MALDITIPAGVMSALKAGTPVPKDAPSTPEPKAESGTEKRDSAPEKKEPKAEPRQVKESKPKEREKGDEPLIEEDKKPEKKIWKLKDGEKEVDYDASDEEAVKRDVQKVRAAERRFEEAAAARREAEEFWSAIQDPKNAEKFRQNPKLMEVAKAAILQEMEEASLTEEEKAQRLKDKRLAHYESQEAAEKATKAERETQARRETYVADYEKRIISALDSGKLPSTERAVSAMAWVLEQAVNQGVDISADEAASIVVRDELAGFKHYVGQMAPEQVMEWLGPDVMAAIRKADLTRVKSTRSNPFPKQEARRELLERHEAPKRLPSKEWKDSLSMADFGEYLKAQRGH